MSGARSTVVAVVCVAEGAASHGLIIRLIIQTIRQDPSGAVWIDGASDVSRPDRSGADQIDAEHQATDLAVGVRIPRGAHLRPSHIKLRLLGRLILKDLDLKDLDVTEGGRETLKGRELVGIDCATQARLPIADDLGASR
jgi:hypothetical protein